MILPERIRLANLPTKIEKLERLTGKLGGSSLFIKRDDQTGTEFSGNKIRKLEFSIAEAMLNGCDTLVTCGGLQSNHARATAAAAAKLGMGCILVLAGEAPVHQQGNLLLDMLLGARVRYVSAEDFSTRRGEIMEEILTELEGQGKKGYSIPLGASNGIGTFGYYACMEEIAQQEKELGIVFDRIVMAVGSGATYAGLFYANRRMGRKTKITGFNISADAAYFKSAIDGILKESFEYTGKPVVYSQDDIDIVDGCVGLGYAISTPEELGFIAELSALEGIVLDPVYTGKAMGGLCRAVMNKDFGGNETVLFIHTGGLYGVFPKNEEFSGR